MRLKLLSIFLAVQLISFVFWSTVSSDEATLQNSKKSTPKETQSVLELASAAITEAGFPQAPQPEVPTEAVTEGEEKQELEVKELYTPHFSARNLSDEQGSIYPIQQDQIKRALSALPLEHAQTVETVSLDYNLQAHRGLGGASLIILRAVDMTSEEFVAVLTHETAHNVDYGFLVPTQQNVVANDFKDGQMLLYETDPSLDFYRISWMSNNQLKPEITELDFVSGYAASDPFEDFAETYAYYVFHNRDFKALATTSEALQAKYNFMKEVVFKGRVFESGLGMFSFDERPWDTTVLPYDLSEFLVTSSSSSSGGEQN